VLPKVNRLCSFVEQVVTIATGTALGFWFAHRFLIPWWG